MTDTEIKNTLASVKASLQVESLQPSKTAVEITEKYLQGIYTSEQAIMAIKLIYI